MKGIAFDDLSLNINWKIKKFEDFEKGHESTSIYRLTKTFLKNLIKFLFLIPALLTTKS